MGIMLGNMTPHEMQARLGITLTDDEIKVLKETHQDDANDIQPGEWHCFDIPFVVVCGDDVAHKMLFDILSPHSKAMKCQIGIGKTKQ